MKGWRTIYHSNGPQKKAGVAILISDKLKFTQKTVVRDEEGHYIILKGSIQQEDLTIMNIYALNAGAAKYSNQLITKVKTYLDNNTLILGDLNTALSTIDRYEFSVTMVSIQSLFLWIVPLNFFLKGNFKSPLNISCRAGLEVTYSFSF